MQVFSVLLHSFFRVFSQFSKNFCDQMCIRDSLQSPYRSQISDIVGSHVLAAMEIDTQNYSEEQLELELEENQLTTQYTQLLSQAVVYETEEHVFTTSDMYYYIYAGGQEDRHLASGLLEERCV